MNLFQLYRKRMGYDGIKIRWCFFWMRLRMSRGSSLVLGMDTLLFIDGDWIVYFLGGSC